MEEFYPLTNWCHLHDTKMHSKATCANLEKVIQISHSGLQSHPNQTPPCTLVEPSNSSFICKTIFYGQDEREHEEPILQEFFYDHAPTYEANSFTDSYPLYNTRSQFNKTSFKTSVLLVFENVVGFQLP